MRFIVSRGNEKYVYWMAHEEESLNLLFSKVFCSIAYQLIVCRLIFVFGLLNQSHFMGMAGKHLFTELSASASYMNSSFSTCTNFCLFKTGAGCATRLPLGTMNVSQPQSLKALSKIHKFHRLEVCSWAALLLLCFFRVQPETSTPGDDSLIHISALCNLHRMMSTNENTQKINNYKLYIAVCANVALRD